VRSLDSLDLRLLLDLVARSVRTTPQIRTRLRRRRSAPPATCTGAPSGLHGDIAALHPELLRRPAGYPRFFWYALASVNFACVSRIGILLLDLFPSSCSFLVGLDAKLHLLWRLLPMWFRGPRFLSRTLVSVAWRIGAGIFFCDGSGVKLIKHYSARSRRVKVMVEWEEFRKKHRCHSHTGGSESRSQS